MPTEGIITAKTWFAMLSDLRIVFSSSRGSSKLDLVVNIADGTWYTQLTNWSVEREAITAIRRRVLFSDKKYALHKWMEQWL